VARHRPVRYHSATTLDLPAIMGVSLSSRRLHRHQLLVDVLYGVIDPRSGSRERSRVPIKVARGSGAARSEHRVAASACGFAGLVMGAWIFMPIFAPAPPHDPLAQSASSFVPPAGGTFPDDELGRDVFSRVLYGARLSSRSRMLSYPGVLIEHHSAIAGYYAGSSTARDALGRLCGVPAIILAMSCGCARPTVPTRCRARESSAAVVRTRRPRPRAVVGQAEYVSKHGCSQVGPPYAHARHPPERFDRCWSLRRSTSATGLLSGLSSSARCAAAARVGRRRGRGHASTSSTGGLHVPGPRDLHGLLAFNFLGDSLRDALDPQSSWSQGGDANEHTPRRARTDRDLPTNRADDDVDDVTTRSAGQVFGVAGESGQWQDDLGARADAALARRSAPQACALWRQDCSSFARRAARVRARSSRWSSRTPQLADPMLSIGKQLPSTCLARGRSRSPRRNAQDRTAGRVPIPDRGAAARLPAPVLRRDAAAIAIAIALAARPKR